MILENKFLDCLTGKCSIEEKYFQLEKDVKKSKDTIEKFSKSTKTLDRALTSGKIVGDKTGPGLLQTTAHLPQLRMVKFSSFFVPPKH